MNIFESAYVIWIIIAIVLGIIELAVPYLITVWLAFAALITSVVAFYFPDNIVLQMIVFLVVTLLFLSVTRPLAMKYLYRKNPEYKDTIIGDEAIVKGQIDEETYEVHVGGQRWLAHATERFAVGDKGLIVSQKGNKLFIQKHQ